MSRSTDIIVTRLPGPDSPTMPSTSPGISENDTPSTARTTPSSVLNETLRSRTSSSGAVAAAAMSATTAGPAGRGGGGGGGPWPLGGPDPGVEAGVEDVDHRVGDRDEERAVDDGRHDHRQVERH